MKKALAIGSTLITALALPLMTLAAPAITSISGVGQFIIDTINNVLVPVLFAISFIVFLWGAFRTFIVGATSDFDKEKGKNLMLYGIIGFVVMASVWGLVAIVTNSLNIGGTQGPGTLPGSGVQIGN